MSKELILSTDMVDDKIRDDFWRDVLKPVFDISTPDTENRNGFNGSIRSRPFGEILIGTTTFNGQHYQRTSKIIAHGGLDQYVVQVMLAGHLRGNFNGVDVLAEPGDILILDLTQTISSHVDAGSRITVVIPRAELEKIVGWRNLHGVVLRSSAPMTRLLFDYLRSLETVASELPPHEAVTAQNSMISLLAAGITGTLDRFAEITYVNVTMRKSILRYIDENLTNPVLGPHSIVKHFRVSRSHLYRAFEIDGGVAKVIRDKRLDIAYHLILDRKGKPLSLKEIAYRCGFHDGTQFTKAFKSRFGHAPKETLDTSGSFQLGDNGAFNFHNHFSERVARLDREVDS